MREKRKKKGGGGKGLGLGEGREELNLLPTHPPDPHLHSFPISAHVVLDYFFLFLCRGVGGQGGSRVRWVFASERWRWCSSGGVGLGRPFVLGWFVIVSRAAWFFWGDGVLIIF